MDRLCAKAPESSLKILEIFVKYQLRNIPLTFYLTRILARVIATYTPHTQVENDKFLELYAI